MGKNSAALIVLIAIAVLGVIGMVTSRGGRMDVPPSVPLGGPFELIDQNGAPFTDKDLSGQWRLIYFGFTYCPAICPTELAKITRALKNLGAAAKDITPVFISVDPERDTPSVIKKYLKSFYPGFIGLTGTPDQIEQVKAAYRVYAKKVPLDGTTGYTVDHSSYIYLFDPSDKIQTLYKTSDTDRMMADDIQKRLKEYKP